VCRDGVAEVKEWEQRLKKESNQNVSSV